MAVSYTHLGLLLSFDPELTRGRTAPALKGRYSVLEGLQRVLSNTGLQVAAGTSGAYLLVEPRMSGEAPADLSPVVVSAAELADPQKETYTAPRSSCLLYTSRSPAPSWVRRRPM